MKRTLIWVYEPRYNEHIFPDPWPFVISRFHCTLFYFIYFFKKWGGGWLSPQPVPPERALVSRLSLWYYLDLARERERQLTSARANQTTGLTNGRAANWAPEVASRAFPSSTDVPVLLLNQPINRDASTALQVFIRRYIVSIPSRTVCTTVVVSGWCIANLAHG